MFWKTMRVTAVLLCAAQVLSLCACVDVPTGGENSSATTAATTGTKPITIQEQLREVAWVTEPEIITRLADAIAIVEILDVREELLILGETETEQVARWVTKYTARLEQDIKGIEETVSMMDENTFQFYHMRIEGGYGGEDYYWPWDDYLQAEEVYFKTGDRLLLLLKKESQKSHPELFQDICYCTGNIFLDGNRVDVEQSFYCDSLLSGNGTYQECETQDQLVAKVYEVLSNKDVVWKAEYYSDPVKKQEYYDRLRRRPTTATTATQTTTATAN